ncbi:FecR domain-containing protein [Pedobacter heparinus]|uniref:FecR domain-containing protein n=1 Tax=Pedobacter heparinus TaxID=984 RepID=UPI00292D67F8|nr:FecR domain-containing protein [Pedobacter heparinus]
MKEITYINLSYYKKLNPIKLHSHQVVSEALNLMGNDKPHSLPVYENGRIIGKLHYDDLIAFLEDEEKDNSIRAHKMHFDIKSAMHAIHSMKLKYYHAALPDDSKKAPAWQFITAAAVLCIIAGLAWLFFNPSASAPVVQGSQTIAGLNRVVLTLENGKKIALNEDKGGISITGNKLTYHDGTTLSISGISGMASVSTSRGGIYQVQLPDGTKVWLNAGSRLKFPATFTNGEKRRVELIGEAYFEVARHNYASAQRLKRLPFTVLSRGQEIAVLGTHFNVKAYPDETTIKTTLLEGLVRVTPLRIRKGFKGADPSVADPLAMMNVAQGALLKPNEEAVLTGNEITVNKVNAAEAIAWRKGDYIFRNAPLENIMLVIARWYDVEVIYQTEDHKKNELLGGVLSKSPDMKDILKSLELTANVRFKVEGKRVTVMQ